MALQQRALQQRQGFVNDKARGSKFGARWEGYIGQPFRIVARVRPAEPQPMWVIEFANGFRMAAYAEEIFEGV